MGLKAFKGMHPFSQFIFSLFVVMVVFIIMMLVSFGIAIPIFGLENLLNGFTNPDYNNPQTINILKFFQTVQSLGLFVIPPIVIAAMMGESIGRFLKFDGKISFSLIALAFLAVFLANPVINYVGAANQNMVFPEWLSGIEQKMKQMEENAAFLLEKFMDVKTTGGLLFNLFMIAVIPALGEELLFRGVIQRIFSDWTRSHHWGIWISAILFSALHMQFYGFVPRMLLGAMFGYMLVWSGSIWIPIFAHFFNNAAGVIGLFLINQGNIDKSIEDIGAGNDQIAVALVSLALTVLFMYLLYKRRKNLNPSETIPI